MQKKISKVKAIEYRMDKSLKLRVDVRAFCIVGIFLKLDFLTSKVERFIIRKSKEKKS